MITEKSGHKALFYCPLCRQERTLVHRERLSPRHYLQILLVSSMATLALYPWMKVRAFILPFIIWVFFETIGKLLFRLELPCPHCGFDAVWYRKDVKVARKLVDQFWQQKRPIPSESSSEVKK